MTKISELYKIFSAFPYIAFSSLIMCIFLTCLFLNTLKFHSHTMLIKFISSFDILVLKMTGEYEN
jgi:hypothetical protein